MALVVPAPEPVLLPIAGSGDRFPVRRVYCVGRNYAAHAREMGSDPDRDPPFYSRSRPTRFCRSPTRRSWSCLIRR